MPPEAEWFRLVADNAADGILVAGDEGPLWMSRSVERTLGWTLDDFDGRPLLDLVHPDDRELLGEQVVRVRDGASASLEVRLVRKDGSSLWVHADGKPLRDASGAVIARLMSWRDIDAEVATRTELVESERRLRVLAENVADVVVIGDDDGRIRWVTDSVTRHLSWRVEDIVDTPFVELVHHGDVSDVRAA